MCRTCGARMSERVANGLCPACLVALALGAEAENDAGTAAPTAPGYRVLTVLRGDDRRTTYLVEEEARRGLFTMDVVRAEACAGMTVDLFEARVRQLCALRHPAIASVVGGQVTADGDYAVIAEYIAGRGLDAFCASNAFTRGEARAVFDTLCDAVACAHARGVIHGDLHPSSVVLLARGGRVTPKVTGYSVCFTPSSVQDDIAGLESALAGLANAAQATADVGNLVAVPTGQTGSRFASVTGLREAAKDALGDRQT